MCASSTLGQLLLLSAALLLSRSLAPRTFSLTPRNFLNYLTLVSWLIGFNAPFDFPFTDMDEECYPAISMTTATNAHGPRKNPHTTNVSASAVIGSQNRPATLGPVPMAEPVNTAAQNRTLHHHTYAAAAGRGRGGTLVDEDGDTNLSDDNDDSEDSSFDSDEVDLDDPMIKEEPLSPSSSCPPSPVMHGNNNTRSKSKTLNNINLSQMAALTNTDLVFEHTVS